MSLTIKRLVIQNFKVFECLELEIESDHLVMLDGPNGFGKSSFFDALELLLTGTIQRYVRLEELTVDGRQQKNGCPWLYNQAKEKTWLSIRAELVIDGQIKFLERAACKTKLDQTKGLKGLELALYELSSLDAERGTAVSDEQSYLTALLGAAFQRDFGLFHYVEQEDNTHLLKQKQKDRQQEIAHLFEIGEIQQKIEKLNRSHTIIGKLCGSQQKAQVYALKAKWEAATQKILPTDDAIDFHRLVKVSNQPWDQENIEHNTEQFEEWLAPEGEIFRIGRFIRNIEQYENQLYNIKLTEKLLPQRELQQRMLAFIHRVQYQQAWTLELQQYDEAMLVIHAFKDVIKATKHNNLTLSPVLTKLLPETISPEGFNLKVLDLKQQISSADKLEESLADLVQMRKQLVAAFEQFQLHSKPTEICPTCGHSWQSVEALFEGIEKQGEALQLLSEQQNMKLTQQLDEFGRVYQEPIAQSLNVFLKKQQDKVDYQRRLVALSQNQVFLLENYTAQLEEAGVQYQDLLLQGYDLNAQVPLSDLEQRVRSKFKPVDESRLYSDYPRIFREIFNSDFSEARKVTTKELDHKTAYLRQQQALASSLHATVCKQSFQEAETQLKKASKIKEHLRKLKDIYEAEKRRYFESIVKRIEILFHIYSGRLMQSYQQGLGIFIENNGNSIAFHEKPGQDHDVVFSMSSGQLSALVLSFTLALNKRYAKHNLLLIDDPVQTLDEINTAGFIELLRTEFSGKQVFISTHEDRMSAFFRYKYKKFSMPVDRINFMEQAQSTIGTQ